VRLDGDRGGQKRTGGGLRGELEGDGEVGSNYPPTGGSRPARVEQCDKIRATGGGAKKSIRNGGNHAGAGGWRNNHPVKDSTKRPSRIRTVGGKGKTPLLGKGGGNP